MRTEYTQASNLTSAASLRLAQLFERTQGEHRNMQNAQPCQKKECSQKVVTTFRSEPLCLEHFCSQCYLLLENMDRRSVNESGRSVTLEQALLADECARRAIDICLNSDYLSNLARARLLDILLWCGDVSAAFRPETAAQVPSRNREPYQKPELARNNSKVAFGN
jgi:hypothetical protein